MQCLIEVASVVAPVVRTVAVRNSSVARECEVLASERPTGDRQSRLRQDRACPLDQMADLPLYYAVGLRILGSGQDAWRTEGANGEAELGRVARVDRLGASVRPDERAKGCIGFMGRLGFSA